MTDEQQECLFDDATLLRCPQGQRVLRPDSLPSQVFLVMSGTVRLLAKSPKGSRTLDRRGAGQLLGWISLLRASPCEWVLASEDTVLLGMPAKAFVSCLEGNAHFRAALAQSHSLHELDAVLQNVVAADARLTAGWQQKVQSLGNSDQIWTTLLEPGVPFVPPKDAPIEAVWLLSTAGVPGMEVGHVVQQGVELPSRSGFGLPYRLIGLDLEGVINPIERNNSARSNVDITPFVEHPGQSLEQLGILEGDLLVLDQRFPEVRGQGQLDEALAVCEMAALQQQVPFRRDAIESA